MKKLLAITMSLVLSLGLLTGCGVKEQSATLTSLTEERGLSMVDTITVDAEGDKIVKMTETIELDMSIFSEEEQAMFVEIYDAMFTEAAAIEGVECTSEVADGIYNMTLVADTSGNAVAELSEIGLLQIDGDSEGALSFDETVEALQASGYTLAE